MGPDRSNTHKCLQNTDATGLEDTLRTSSVEEAMAAIRKQRFVVGGLLVWLGRRTYTLGLELD